MNNLLLRRTVWVIILICTTAGLGFWITLKRRPPEPPPVMILARPYSTPVHLRDWVGQWIPRRPGWLWAMKAQDFVFGRRTIVTLSTQIMGITNSATLENPDFKLRTSDYSNSNGLRIWFMPASELKSLRENFRQSGTETINHPRITTADGIPTTLFSGESVLINGETNQVGIEVAYFARASKQRTDLFASIQLTETKTNAATTAQGALRMISLQTNLDVAVRLQIPKGSGVFMVNAAPLDPNGKRIGVIIDPP